MKKLKLLSLLMISMLLLSCEDNKDFGIVTNNINYTNSINQENPYEQVGIVHNILLTEFVRLYDSTKNVEEIDTLVYPYEIRSWTIPILYKTFNNIFPENTFSIQAMDSIYNEIEAISYINNSGSYEFMYAQAKYFIDSYATSKDSTYLTNFLSDIESLLDNFDSNTDILIDYMAIINKHESLILSQQWDSTESFSLGFLAVAKHSCEFWQQYFNQIQNYNQIQTSNNHYKYNIQETKKDPKQQVLKGVVVTCDAVGSIVGSIKGAILGSTLGGPLATLGGYYVGKLYGAVIGSGTALTVISLVDFWKKINE